MHPGFEYWGRQDPTQGQNRKVPWDKASNRVARMMQGVIRDKGCPKAHCLKRLTSAASVLSLYVLFFYFLKPFPLFCRFNIHDTSIGF